MEAPEGGRAPRPVVQRVPLDRIGVPRLGAHRVGELPAVWVDRPRPVPAVVLHEPRRQDARRPRDRDQPAPRRRIPRLHAALVLLPHERLRPEHAPRRHPARPAADRPAGCRGRRGAHAARARTRARHRQGARRTVPGDRSRRPHVPPGAARLRRHLGADHARVPRRQHPGVLQLRLGSHRPSPGGRLHDHRARHRRVRPGAARRARCAGSARRRVPRRHACSNTSVSTISPPWPTRRRLA